MGLLNEFLLVYTFHSVHSVSNQIKSEDVENCIQCSRKASFNTVSIGRLKKAENINLMIIWCQHTRPLLTELETSEFIKLID